jgi:hypothetical protein
VSYYCGGPPQRCANPTCRNTFVPNFYGRHRIYCGPSCKVTMWRRRKQAAAMESTLKRWREQHGNTMSYLQRDEDR